MINIYYTSFTGPLEQSLYLDYLALLPQDIQEKNSRFIRWQDRHLHLFGKLLLLKALKTLGVDDNFWNYIEYNLWKRPYLTFGNLDFNISHSGNFVICAVGKDIRLGIDIEENRNVKLKNFLGVMSTDQWKEINNSDQPIREFYKYWTIKESVIKADGRGFLIPLDQLNLINNTVSYEDQSWHVQELHIDKGYNAALATDQMSELKIQQIDYT